jgi:hypothetical protein
MTLAPPHPADGDEAGGWSSGHGDKDLRDPSGGVAVRRRNRRLRGIGLGLGVASPDDAEPI